MTHRGAAMAAVLGLAWAGLAAPAFAGTVLVLSQTDARLTAVDDKSGAIRGSLELAKGPANLATSPDGAFAYVAHSDLGAISVVDLAGWRVASTFKVRGSPFGLAASSSNKLYVGDWNGDAVHELNATSGQELRAAKVGKAPAHLALTPDGTRLVAAAREANTVTVIDVATFAALASLPVERAPFALAISHDGKRAFVANAQAGSVSTIDLAKLQVTATTHVGAMPHGVAVTSDDVTTLITNQQSGSVAVLTGTGPTKDATFKVGSYPEGIAVSPGGDRAFVANWFSDDLSIVDIAGAKQVSRIKVPGGPRAVAFVTGSFGR